MDHAEVHLEARPLDAEGWLPFGWLPFLDTDPRDGESRLHFAWDDVHVNLIGHSADEIVYTERGLICEMLFRHLTHTQAILVLNCPAVMAVAPPTCTFETKDDLAQVRAFRLEPHDSFVLGRGTWHWGPFPLSAPRVELFNVQGLRYAEDNDCALLANLGTGIEVVAK